MDKPVLISAFDCEIVRGAFTKSVIEMNIPEDQWRSIASRLIGDFTDSDDIDPELLEWIVRKH